MTNRSQATVKALRFAAFRSVAGPEPAQVLFGRREKVGAPRNVIDGCDDRIEAMNLNGLNGQDARSVELKNRHWFASSQKTWVNRPRESMTFGTNGVIIHFGPDFPLPGCVVHADDVRRFEVWADAGKACHGGETERRRGGL